MNGSGCELGTVHVATVTGDGVERTIVGAPSDHGVPFWSRIVAVAGVEPAMEVGDHVNTLTANDSVAER